jgi:hypothetical protein
MVDDSHGTVFQCQRCSRGTIMDMINQGYPFEPMLNFLDNMSQNPSDHAIVELFEFMENKNMPITPDGHFLAYKAVRGDYKDLYSHTFDNSVGSTCEIERQQGQW